MEELKDILGEELHAQVIAKLGDKKVVVDTGNFIPKHRFDEKIEEVKSLKALKEKYEADINALKPLVDGNATLSKQVSDMDASLKKMEADTKATQLKVQKAFAVKEALMNAGVENPEARELLSLKFDVDKIELDEKGQPKGFDEALKPMKENTAFKGLFGTKKMKGQEHQEGEVDLSLGEYAKNNPFSKATLNITKQIELKRTNPALYAKLQASAQK